MTTAPDPTTAASPPPFGSAFTDSMAVARWADGDWGEPSLEPVGPLPLHPGSHVLHYGSACFEGLKAHRGDDGTVRIFRLDRHAARLQLSADALLLPIPSDGLVEEMIIETVAAVLDDVPEAPGSLYLRPTLIGTEQNIGAAARPADEAMLFVLASPVGDYFAGGLRPLTVSIETTQPRTTPLFGSIKAGANYAMALRPTRRAVEEHGADQVLFAPGGRIEETGASNFLLVDGERVVTPELTGAFLHGVTRDSVLRIAADLGYEVEERAVGVDELIEWAARPDAEAALSGTAAVLAPVGHLVRDGERLPVGSGAVGEHTMRLRGALVDVHRAAVPDHHGWLTPVTL